MACRILQLISQTKRTKSKGQLDKNFLIKNYALVNKTTIFTAITNTKIQTKTQIQNKNTNL